MFFWIFMFACNLLIPGFLLVFGRILQKRPPQDINWVFGYRTWRSTKNRDTWLFAQICWGRIAYRCSLVMLAVTVVWMLAIRGFNDDALGWAGGLLSILQCVGIIATIFPVERALKREFDESGKRRQSAEMHIEKDGA